MKKLFSIATLVLGSLNLFGQNSYPLSEFGKNSFPTNINEENFKDLKNFNSKVVAFDGTIERIEKSNNNTPFYKLNIGEKKFLWTVLMFKNDASKIGDKIRVVGYVMTTKPLGGEKEFLEGKLMVLSFGLVDFKNKNFLFLTGSNAQRQEWIDGKIPTME